MYFALRFLIAIGILVPYMLFFGGRSPVATFAVAFVAFGLGHVVVAWMRHRRKTNAWLEGSDRDAGS